MSDPYVSLIDAAVNSIREAVEAGEQPADALRRIRHDTAVSHLTRRVRQTLQRLDDAPPGTAAAFVDQDPVATVTASILFAEPSTSHSPLAVWAGSAFVVYSLAALFGLPARLVNVLGLPAFIGHLAVALTAATLGAAVAPLAARALPNQTGHATRSALATDLARLDVAYDVFVGHFTSDRGLEPLRP